MLKKFRVKKVLKNSSSENLVLKNFVLKNLVLKNFVLKNFAIYRIFRNTDYNYNSKAAEPKFKETP